ncbi:MAG: family 10 glycosylhydrolase [Gemmatimonadaceae bacterium]|nr:family 10 glycosylhydrolase [Gemmatimonadaceae bacterium]
MSESSVFLRRGCLAAVVLLAACRADLLAPGAEGPPLAPPTASSRSATPAWAEARALWVTRYEYDSPAKIATIMQKAADANFNIVYFQVRGSGDAYYVSSLEPCAVSLCGHLGGTPTWDPLAVAVQEAHSRGLQVHAWLNIMTAWGSGSATTCGLLKASDAGQPLHPLLAHPDWAVVNSAGARQACPNNEEYTYFSPGIPAVRTHIARVAADIARRYAVDGIQLDRIRYPGTAWSYDSPSKTAFGLDPATSATAWADFRRSQVLKAEKEVYDSVRVVKPSIAISADIWPIYIDKWGWNSSQGFKDYFQDPLAWAQGGHFDVAVPMTYYPTTPTYCAFTDWSCLLDDHLQRIQTTGGRHVYIGIGAKNGAAEVDKQIALARQQGAMGVSLYSYNTVESNALWTSLKSGPFAAKAGIPPLSWKTACCTSIVVDNNNAGNNISIAYAEMSANWTSSSYAAGEYGTDYQYASTQAVSDPATFWFYLPSAATRTVSAWWTSGSNRSTTAPYVIYNAAATKLATVNANQQLNGGKWNTLGTFSFTAGWNKVQLSRWTTAGSTVVADAIRVQ